MASKTTPKKKTAAKAKPHRVSRQPLAKSNFNFWLAVFITIVVAAIGSYWLFSAKAAANTCDEVKGGFICNVAQAGNDTDALVDAGSGEAEAKVKAGWTDLGVAFKVPNFAQDGAQEVHRFYNATNTSHILAIKSSPAYTQMVNDTKNFLDEGIFFWAWPTAGQAGTTAIYAVTHSDTAGGPISFVRYVDSIAARDDLLKAQAQSYYADGGIAFYAYSARYTLPVALAATNTPLAMTPIPSVTISPTPEVFQVSKSAQATAASPAHIMSTWLNYTGVQSQESIEGEAPYYVPPPDQPYSITAAPDVEEDQFNRINTTRATNPGNPLPAWTRTGCLDAAAREWTLRMINEHNLHHSATAAEKAKRTWPWVDAHCPGTRMSASENVGVDGTMMYELFMLSAGHRENILRDFRIDPSSHQNVNGIGWIGVGAYREGTRVWVTHSFVSCNTTCSTVYSASSY